MGLEKVEEIKESELIQILESTTDFVVKSLSNSD